MSKRWDAIRGNAGFFATMAVCLLVVGMSGYFLLTDRETESAGVAPENAVVAAAEIPEKPAPKPMEPVEVLAPKQVEVTEKAEPMPEIVVEALPVAAEAPRLTVEPLQGEVITAFSVDALIYNATLGDWRTHEGVDIAAEMGSAVLAASSGAVIAVENDALLGTLVVLEHEGGYQTTYANLESEPPVNVGDRVSAGQIIGTVGSTSAAEAAQGPHLHFSVTKHGEQMDPNDFLKQ